MMLSRCENCKHRAFFPRKRKYTFSFLPIGTQTSEDKLCSVCFKKTIYVIKRSHNQLAKLSKIEKYILAKVAKRMAINRTPLLENIGLTIQLRKI